MRPENLYHYDDERDVITLGTRLIEAIGKNHCFIQGNKRTAFHAGMVFMHANGCPADVLDDPEVLGKIVEGLITSRVDATEVAEFFRSRCTG